MDMHTHTTKVQPNRFITTGKNHKKQKSNDNDDYVENMDAHSVMHGGKGDRVEY